MRWANISVPTDDHINKWMNDAQRGTWQQVSNRTVCGRWLSHDLISCTSVVIKTQTLSYILQSGDENNQTVLSFAFPPEDSFSYILFFEDGSCPSG